MEKVTVNLPPYLIRGQNRRRGDKYLDVLNFNSLRNNPVQLSELKTEILGKRNCRNDFVSAWIRNLINGFVNNCFND